MLLTIYANPDGPEADTSTVPADSSWVDGVWGQVASILDTVPTLAWVALVIVMTALTLLAVPFLRTQAFKAGTRHGKKQLTDEDRRDRRLLIAAMVPASLFWVAVIVGSGRGLIAFGREDLHWKDGWEFLVPFTLDGVAISFTLLAFRAVKKQLNPDRAIRIAALAMIASAGINFLHEVGGSKLGAGYLAILSLLGMLIVDELLGQFELGAEVDVRRKNPKFGLRWLTWPTNTMCAWVAWRNYPPAEALKATVGNAVLHLETVRRQKVTRNAQQIDSPVWWMRLAPWAHVHALRIALDSQRRVSGANLTDLTNTVSDLTSRLEQQRSRFEAERSRSAERIRSLETNLEALQARLAADLETAAADKAEALRDLGQRLSAEMAEKVAKARAEAKIPNLGDRRDRVSAKGSPKTTLTDEAALQALLSDPGDPARSIPSGDLREWSQKAIVDKLSVGFERAKRLQERVTEMQRGDRPGTAPGDPAVNQ